MTGGFITYHGNVGNEHKIPVRVPTDAGEKVCVFVRQPTGQIAWRMDKDGEEVWAYLDAIDETGEYYKRTMQLVDDGTMIETLSALQEVDFKKVVSGVRDIPMLHKIAQELTHVEPSRADFVLEQVDRMKKALEMRKDSEKFLAELDESEVEENARKAKVNAVAVREAVKVIKKKASLLGDRKAVEKELGRELTDEEWKEVGKQTAS